MAIGGRGILTEYPFCLGELSQDAPYLMEGMDEGA